MSKNTLFFVVLMFFAGATGGVCAFLLARTGGDAGDQAGVVGPPAREMAARREKPVVSEVDWLAMRTEVSGLARKVEDLTGKLDEANAKLEEASRDDGHGASPGEVLARGLTGGPVRWNSTGKDGLAATGLRLAGMGKMAELMALPEEERWAKIREDLSLDAYQESELKRIAEEVKADSMSFLADRSDGEAKFDPMEFIGKMVEKRKKTREQVKNLLSENQMKKFDEGGYGAAMGLGTTSVAVSYGNLGSPSEPRDK